MFDNITEFFCFIEDFYKIYEKHERKTLIEQNKTIRKPTRVPELTMAEIMTITLLYNQSGYKNFKAYYQAFKKHHLKDFPKMPTYERFIILKKRIHDVLFVFLSCLLNPEHVNEAFIDSTPLRVCHNKRIFNHKVFKEFAKRGKSTMGYFYGFKLHIVTDLKGNLISARITPGNVDDRTPVKQMLKRFKGTVYADKGYISKTLFKSLMENEIKLVTGVKSNMKNILMPIKDKLHLRKRSVIESTISVLKRGLDIEHSRHRSFQNFLVNCYAALIMYQLKPSKPSIRENYAILNFCPEDFTQNNESILALAA